MVCRTAVAESVTRGTRRRVAPENGGQDSRRVDLEHKIIIAIWNENIAR
jgi:hypothetical protein